MSRSAQPRSGTWSELPVAPPPKRRRPRPPRLLVAEDDPELRCLLIECLRKDGYEVVDVANGNDLLIRITSHYRLCPDPEPIDLILTDVRMPIVSGIDIARGLRDAEWTTPIVLITAFADEDVRMTAQALDAVLLDKPFQLEVLRSCVRRLLA